MRCVGETPTPQTLVPHTPETIRLIRSLSDSVGGDTQTLCTLLDLLPVGVAIAHDRECKHISLNRAAAQLLGLPMDLDIADSALPFQFKHNGKVLDAHEMPMQLAVTSGKELREIELELWRSDGAVLHLYEYASPLKNASGAIVGCIVVYVDVTAASHRRDRRTTRRRAHKRRTASSRSAARSGVVTRRRRASKSASPSVCTMGFNSFFPPRA